MDKVVISSPINNHNIAYNSYASCDLFITSKICNQSLISVAAVFGRIVFNQSIFGYRIQYGAILHNSRMSTTMELTSALQNESISHDSAIAPSIVFNSKMYQDVQMISQLMESIPT